MHKHLRGIPRMEQVISLFSVPPRAICGNGCYAAESLGGFLYRATRGLPLMNNVARNPCKQVSRLVIDYCVRGVRALRALG